MVNSGVILSTNLSVRSEFAFVDDNGIVNLANTRVGRVLSVTAATVVGFTQLILLPGLDESLVVVECGSRSLGLHFDVVAGGVHHLVGLSSPFDERDLSLFNGVWK